MVIDANAILLAVITAIGAGAPSVLVVWLQSAANRKERAEIRQERVDATTAITKAVETSAANSAKLAVLVPLVATVKETIEVVKAGVDGMSNEKAKVAADAAEGKERARGQDTADKVAEARAAGRAETVGAEAPNKVVVEPPAVIDLEDVESLKLKE